MVTPRSVCSPSVISGCVVAAAKTPERRMRPRIYPRHFFAARAYFPSCLASDIVVAYIESHRSCLSNFVYGVRRAVGDLPLKIEINRLSHTTRGEQLPMTDLKEIVMTTGTVKFFNSTKGFGFIEQGNGQPDVFVHISSVERAGMRSLVEGQKLSFEVQKERGKSAAVNIKEA